jgi:hypothetical protein
MSDKTTVKCEGCKKAFEQNSGRGRPRKFCKGCRPSRKK